MSPSLAWSPEPSSRWVWSPWRFGSAALAAWFNSEFASRRWPFIAERPLDTNALRALSYMAVLCGGLTAWLVLSGPWTILPWLAIALLLAFISARLSSEDLAQQADLLSLAAIARAGAINFTQWDSFAHQPRVVILLAATAMLYAHMRRRQAAHLFRLGAIEPFCTWAAAAMLGVLAWYALEPAAVSVAWCMLGMILVELGLATCKPFLRHQGFCLLFASFLRLFFINVSLAPAPRLYTMIPLAVVYAWVYQRLYASAPADRVDRIAATASAWFALGTVATLVYFSLRPAWVAIGAAVLVIAVLLLARVSQRSLFSAQAFVIVAAAAGRTIAFNVFSMEPLAARFAEGRLFTVGSTCILLLAALPIAFSIRRQQS